MSGKISLTEATMLALQGKLNLEESKEVDEKEKELKTEDVEINTSDVDVVVGEDTTIIESEEATIIVQENETEQVVEVPEVEDIPSEETEVIETEIEDIPSEEVPSIDEIVDEEVIEESKETKTESVDPRPNETKLLDYFESVGSDWEEVAKNLLGYMSDDDIKRFAEIYEYSFEDEDDEETQLEEANRPEIGNVTLLYKDGSNKEISVNEISKEDLSNVEGIQDQCNLIMNITDYERLCKEHPEASYADLVEINLNESKKIEENLEADDEDGWGSEIVDLCAEFFEKVSKIEYEINNCRRGTYAGFGDTVEDLSDAMSELSEMSDEIATELDSRSRVLQEKFNSETFNKALTEYYKSKNDYVECVKLNKLSKNNENIKIEAVLTNKDGISKDICLEMKRVKSGEMFEKYSLIETKSLKTESNKSTKSMSMMTFTNKDKVLECKYLK